MYPAIMKRQITLLQVTLQGYPDPGTATAAAELKARQVFLNWLDLTKGGNGPASFSVWSFLALQLCSSRTHAPPLFYLNFFLLNCRMGCVTV